MPINFQAFEFIFLLLIPLFAASPLLMLALCVYLGFSMNSPVFIFLGTFLLLVFVLIIAIPAFVEDMLDGVKIRNTKQKEIGRT